MAEYFFTFLVFLKPLPCCYFLPVFSASTTIELSGSSQRFRFFYDRGFLSPPDSLSLSPDSLEISNTLFPFSLSKLLRVFFNAIS